MSTAEIKIFYSWQSDLPSKDTRGLIGEGIKKAVRKYRNTVEIDADSDTRGETGSPDIVQTIFSKIDNCDIFIADVSIINKFYLIDGEKRAIDIISNNIDKLTIIAEALIKYETLTGQEIKDLIEGKEIRKEEDEENKESKSNSSLLAKIIEESKNEEI